MNATLNCLTTGWSCCWMPTHVSNQTVHLHTRMKLVLGDIFGFVFGVQCDEVHMNSDPMNSCNVSLIRLVVD